MLRLAKNDILLNEPVRWSIYRYDGTLVLRAGSLVSTQVQLNRLLSSNLYRDDRIIVDESYMLERRTRHTAIAATRQDMNPFSHIDRLVPRLRKLFADIKDGHEECPARILKIAEEIQELYEYDHNACQGALHIYYEHPYSLLHPIYSAFLCEMTALLLDYSQEDRLKLICAALTANISMYEEYDRLNQQEQPPDRMQRQVIMRHPELSCKMLKTTGVRDYLWMTIVEQHHEKSDGSGYPNQVQDDEIMDETKVLSLADSYLAMITPRAYRKALLPHIALQKVYNMANGDDENIYLSFIKQLGIYPPGTMVCLDNNEIAIITHHAPDNSLKSKAASLISPVGQYYGAPIMRDTSNPEFKIREIHNPKEPPNINPTLVWHYDRNHQ